MASKAQFAASVMGDDMDDELYIVESEIIEAQPERKKYPKLYPEELEYRPAAMDPFPSIIRQMQALAHGELSRYQCERIGPVKVKPDPEAHRLHGDGSAKAKQTLRHVHHAPESMERRLNRLKIYRRVLGSMVTYFKAYAPILFYIKKSYDDMLTFRINQFKEAQLEKLRIYHENVATLAKLGVYQYPAQELLDRSKQHLSLLLGRISKQDESIRFVTEVLRKMEQALNDYYEKERDLEDQLKLLDEEIQERLQRAMMPTIPSFEIPEEEKQEKPELSAVERFLEDDGEAEPIDENEEIDDDKRTVLILAYAVCMQDYEEATKKLTMYETEYQNVSPRHELETMKRKISEEKAQVHPLQDELHELEHQVMMAREEQKDADRELEDINELPEELKMEAVKKKFDEYKNNGIFSDEEEEDEDEEEEEEELNEDDSYF